MKTLPQIWHDQPTATEFAHIKKGLEAKGFFVSSDNSVDTLGRTRRKIYDGDVQPLTPLIELTKKHNPTPSELKVLILSEVARPDGGSRGYIVTRLLQFHQTATRENAKRRIAKYVGI